MPWRPTRGVLLPCAFCPHSFLASFATLFFPCASASLLQRRLQQHLCYRNAFLRSFVCLMPHLCRSICSSLRPFLNRKLAVCLSVCSSLSALFCVFSLGMSDSSSSLQFALDQLGSRTRSCCLAGSICLMN